MTIIAVNVGNSTIAAARTDGHSVADRISVAASGSGAELDRFTEALHRMGEGRLPLAVASVNAPLFENLAKRLSRPLPLVGREVPLPLPNRCRRPERTGHDRLLDGYAAGVLHGLPAIAVDFGTALTFNVVDRSGAFIGGAILPGPGLASRALGSGCEQLPVIDLHGSSGGEGGVDSVLGPGPVIGRDTEEAIRSGLLHGYAGLVDHMVEAIRKELGVSCSTVATGGEAVLIASRAKAIDVHDQDLILKGIALAHDAARAS